MSAELGERDNPSDEDRSDNQADSDLEFPPTPRRSMGSSRLVSPLPAAPEPTTHEGELPLALADANTSGSAEGIDSRHSLQRL